MNPSWDLCNRAMLHPHTANVLNGGKSIRTGNRHPNIVPYDLFPTATVPLFLAIGNDLQFRTLCKEPGDEALGADPLYLGNDDRVVNRIPLRERLVDLLQDHDGLKLFPHLMDPGVPCAPVLTVEQALVQDHTKTREMVVELGYYKGPGLAVKLDRTPGSVHLPPPKIGEHSREVLERFGLGADLIASLLSTKVVCCGNRIDGRAHESQTVSDETL